MPAVSVCVRGKLADDAGFLSALRAMLDDVPVATSQSALSWLSVFRLGPYILIGPASVPGRAPCPRCLDQRILQHGLMTGADITPLSADVSMAVAGHVLAEVRALERDVADSEDLSPVQVFDSGTRLLSSWRLAPVHGCSACAGAPEEDRACVREHLRSLFPALGRSG